MSPRITRTLLLLGTGMLLAAANVPAAPVYLEAMMPTSGGAHLHTRAYLPAGSTHPVMLGRTPYAYHGEEGDWSSIGIAFVQQATRGQWQSTGVYNPFLGHDADDGRTLVDWALAQTWCNGRVGIFAGSAKGTLTALSLPGARGLACFILRPTATNVADQFIYQGGVFRKSLADDWLGQWAIDAPHLADEWRQRPPSDPWWHQFNVEARAEEVTAPGLHRAGYFDVVGRGTINFFMACQYRGGPGARGRQHLVMTPTAHTRYEYLEGLTFDFHPNYRDFDFHAFERVFAEHYLHGIDHGLDDRLPVTYYVIGDDQAHDGPGWEWRTALRWPPLPPRKIWHYLHPDGRLDTTAPTADSGSITFAYDPSNPVTSLGGQNIKAGHFDEKLAYGPYDQNTVSARADVLRYYSDPVSEPLEATGPFYVRLHVGSDAPDTDFTVKLVDVYPAGDGREILMLDTIQRVKYRHGVGEPAAPLVPGEVVLLEIELGHIAWVFNTGHRVGLHVSSSNYPRFDVNPNNGDDIPGQNPSRVAWNTVYANRLYASALSIPVRMPDHDTDGDGLTDEEEWNSPDGDMDGDGLSDEEEYYRWEGLDPFNPDSDGDGWSDGDEVAHHTDPTDPESYPGSPTERRHSADTNQNKRIEMNELLRVIQLYNAGAYHCAGDESTEDGYVPGPGADTTCAPHDADYIGEPDWRLVIAEVLRVIQFFNSGGYHACPGSDSEDGFCPGLAR